MSDTMLVGTKQVRIEYYGTIIINVLMSTGPNIMTLINVVYIPEFMTNIISQSILKAKRLCYDGWKDHLHCEEKIIVKMSKYNRYLLLKDNVQAIFAAKQLKNTSKTTNLQGKKKIASSHN